MSDKKPNFRKGHPACFAPPLTAERLADYKQQISLVPAGPMRDALDELCLMVETFQQTPATQARGESIHVPPLGKTVQCCPLEDAEVDRIWDVVPWEHEINAMAELFESIDNGTHKPLRDAAFHLIWYARELVRDREPMTQECLK